MEMDLRERRWYLIEESSKMRGANHPKKTRMVSRRYEPDRLSPIRLADAYEKLVPRCIRVLEDKSSVAKTERVDECQVVGG